MRSSLLALSMILAAPAGADTLVSTAALDATPPASKTLTFAGRQMSKSVLVGGAFTAVAIVTFTSLVGGDPERGGGIICPHEFACGLPPHFGVSHH